MSDTSQFLEIQADKHLVGFKVKIRVTHPQGQREKYSFQLNEGELFPLGSQTEGLMRYHPELAPEEAAVYVREGKVYFRSKYNDSVVVVGDQREIGPFNLELLETTYIPETLAMPELEPEPEPATTVLQNPVSEPQEPSIPPPSELSLSGATRVGSPVPESLHVPDRLTMTSISASSDSSNHTSYEPVRTIAVERPESTATSLQYQERFEKTSATAMIQRRRNIDDKITRYSLIAAAAVIVLAVPFYFNWLPAGWFGGAKPTSDGVAQFPVAADPWSKEVSKADKPPAEAKKEESSAVANAHPTTRSATTAPTTTVTGTQQPAALATSLSTPSAARTATASTDALIGTEIFDAATAGNIAVLTKLIDERHQDIHQFSSAGLTLLMTAAANGRVETVQFLVSRGASVNTTDRLGTTALMWATMKGQFKTAMALVEAGAEPGMARLDGDTAQKIAERWGFKRMSQYLANPRGYKRAQERAIAHHAAQKVRAAASATRKPASTKPTFSPKAKAKTHSSTVTKKAVTRVPAHKPTHPAKRSTQP